MKDDGYAKMWAILQADIDERIAKAIESKEEMMRYAKSAFERAMRDKNDAIAISDEIYAKNMMSELNGIVKALMWVRDRMEEIKEEKENCDD